MSLAGGGPQVKKFERVSGLGHQMSLARGPGLRLGGILVQGGCGPGPG